MATPSAKVLLLALESPVLRMSSVPAAMVRWDPCASSWIAPITTSSPARNVVDAVPITVRDVPIETLPEATELAVRLRNIRSLAAPLTVFEVSLFSASTVYVGLAGAAESMATKKAKSPFGAMFAAVRNANWFDARTVAPRRTLAPVFAGPTIGPEPVESYWTAAMMMFGMLVLAAGSDVAWFSNVVELVVTGVDAPSPNTESADAKLLMTTNLTAAVT